MNDGRTGLNYVDRFEPGIRRKKTRSGFSYIGPDGRALTDAVTLDRIKGLVLPPAWTDVWICADPKGHIQATGRDARGRLQYRYHAEWRASQDQAKYERMVDFGRRLPRLRKQVSEDLAHRGLPREKVLAAVVALLEKTLIRVGNDAYARDNRSFGLTTLRKRHAVLGATGAVFEFKGKSGVKHVTGFRDSRLARVVRACQELPGQRLFQYVGEDGTRHAVTSVEVNAYIHDALGEDFSAKDFRTWAGGLAAAEFLSRADPPQSEAEADRIVRQCVKAVSARLGNTPAVCRACYIHPRVIEAYRAGELGGAGEGADAEKNLIRLLRAGRSG